MSRPSRLGDRRRIKLYDGGRVLYNVTICNFAPPELQKCFAMQSSVKNIRRDFPLRSNPTLMDQEATLAAEHFRGEMFQGVSAVAQHIKHRAELLDGIMESSGTVDRETHLRILFVRVRAWMKSLCKLDEASDIQAVAACTRALMEIAVDMLLLHADKSNDSGERMRWWNLSAELQMAIAFLQSHKERHTQDTSVFEPQGEFIERNAEFVSDLRKRW